MSANKQIVSPDGLVPSWANNVNLVDGGKPWDATPTKVEPGAGKRDLGYKPDEKPDAQHINKLLNELARWVQFFSDVQMQNWQDMGKPEKAGGSVNTANFVIADDGMGGTGGFVVGGRSGVTDYSINEHEWNELAAMPAETLTWGAAGPNAGGPSADGQWIAGGDATNKIFQYPNSTDDTIPGAGAVSNTGVYSGPINKFAAGGKDNTGPAVWYATLTAGVVGAWTEVQLTPTNSTKIVCMAANPNTGRIVAWGDGTNGENWYSDDGIAWTKQLQGLLAGGARSLAWDPVRNTFVLCCQHKVFISPDGIAWADVAADISSFNFQFRCLAIAGLHYVAATDAGGPQVIWSTDGGKTWRLYSVESNTPLTALPIHAIAYSRIRSRFLVTWADSPNSGRVMRSLSLGTTMLATGGVSAPTVT